MADSQHRRHHIHHLYSRIPYYRLPELVRDYPELRYVRRITLLKSFGLIKLKLWIAIANG